MFTVALIGPDGAGKTTVGRRLERALPLPARYMYMGVNWDASDVLLPTTRLMQWARRARGSTAGGGRVPPSERRHAAGGLLRRAPRGVWRALSLVNRLAEEWYRQLLSWTYVRRGVVVIFDRHFFADYHAHDIAGRGPRSLDRQVHGLLLARFYPKPDLIVYLDAPAETLFARKGEGTLESLEQRRRDYRELATHGSHFVTVDATRPVDDVVGEVAGAIEAFAQARSSAHERA